MSDRTSHKVPNYVVACDIGGTKIRSALVARDGSVSARFECSTAPERGFNDATIRLTGLIKKSLARISSESVAGISISSAGPVNPGSGIYSHPPNLPGWHGYSMIPYLNDETGLEVTVIHDAHAAALAEARFGAARHAKVVVYVTVSTGIGGGMISDGKPITGENGFAGEIGHMILNPDGPECNAGCRGCLEVLASGGGIAAQARRRVESGAGTKILELAGGEVSGITAKRIFRAANAGDPVASEIIDTAIDALATGIANLLATFDPGALVIGGSVSTGDDQVGGLSDYWDDLLDRVKARAVLRYRDEVPIVKSALGDDVGLIGAATYLFENLQSGK